MPKIELIRGDCLETLKTLPDKSVDLILQDPPYNTTACKWEWDIMTKIDEFWAEWKRVIKDNGAIVMTASQPFTSKLVMSNLKWFKYEWVWVKNRITGFANAKKQPLRNIEQCLVFYSNLSTYNPQGLIRINKKCKNGKSVGGQTIRTDILESAGKGSLRTKGKEYIQEFTGYPKQTILNIQEELKLHPTQKPVALMEYLIKTYTNEGDTVFDGFMGSGTTGVACKNLNRNFIGIELDPEYFKIAEKRINENT